MASTHGKRSRDKGKCGERELVNWLKAYGIEASRGFQARGGSAEEPDIVHNIPGLHIECKRNEQMTPHGGLLRKAMDQAKADAGELIPCVFWRVSRQPWMVSWEIFGELLVTTRADAWMEKNGYLRTDATESEPDE